MTKVKADFKYGFSQEIYESTYRFGDETIETTLARVAKGLAEAETEEKREKIREQFEDLLSDFKFIPGGRILSNAGAELKGTTLINCFVSGPHEGETDLDSMHFIHTALGRQMNILKSEGGYGANFDFLRPRGAFIKGIASTSPGAVVMMELWDKSSEVITSGSGSKYTGKKVAKGKIRKGAQMSTLSCFSKCTELLTDKGWVNIVSLCEQFDSGVPFKILTENGFFDMSFAIINPPKELYVLETECGSKIESTIDHMYVVHNIETGEEYLKELGKIDPESELLVCFDEE